MPTVPIPISKMAAGNAEPYTRGMIRSILRSFWFRAALTSPTSGLEHDPEKWKGDYRKFAPRKTVARQWPAGGPISPKN